MAQRKQKSKYLKSPEFLAHGDIRRIAMCKVACQKKYFKRLLNAVERWSTNAANWARKRENKTVLFKPLKRLLFSYRVSRGSSTQ